MTANVVPADAAEIEGARAGGVGVDVDDGHSDPYYGAEPAGGSLRRAAACASSLPEPGPVVTRVARVRDPDPAPVQVLLRELDSTEPVVVADDDCERHAVRPGGEE